MSHQTASQNQASQKNWIFHFCEWKNGTDLTYIVALLLYFHRMGLWKAIVRIANISVETKIFSISANTQHTYFGKHMSSSLFYKKNVRHSVPWSSTTFFARNEWLFWMKAIWYLK